MLPQSQIQRTLNAAHARDRIVEILAREAFDSRSALGRRLCEEFGFADNRGRWQLAGCLKALSAVAAVSDEIVKLIRFGGHLNIAQRRCPAVEETDVARAPSPGLQQPTDVHRP